MFFVETSALLLGAADENSEGVSAAFDELSSFFLGTIAPAAFLLVVAVIGVRMSVRWLFRSARGGFYSLDYDEDAYDGFDDDVALIPNEDFGSGFDGWR